MTLQLRAYIVGRGPLYADHESWQGRNYPNRMLARVQDFMRLTERWDFVKACARRPPLRSVAEERRKRDARQEDRAYLAALGLQCYLEGGVGPGGWRAAPGRRVAEIGA